MDYAAMPIRPDDSASWAAAATKSGADADPTLGTHGTAMAGGAQIVQWQTHTLTAITDYEIRVWGYINSQWSVVQQWISQGAVARIGEARVGGLKATRYHVTVSTLTGTSLKLQTRQI